MFASPAQAQTALKCVICAAARAVNKASAKCSINYLQEDWMLTSFDVVILAAARALLPGAAALTIKEYQTFAA